MPIEKKINVLVGEVDNTTRMTITDGIKQNGLFRPVGLQKVTQPPKDPMSKR